MSPSFNHLKLPDNGAQSSPSIFCSPTAEHILTGSTNYPSLTFRFRETYLKHGVGDIMLPKEPSSGHHATEMVGDISLLLRENHWKHITKDCKVRITRPGKELPMVTKIISKAVSPISCLLTPRTKWLTPRQKRSHQILSVNIVMPYVYSNPRCPSEGV